MPGTPELLPWALSLPPRWPRPPAWPDEGSGFHGAGEALLAAGGKQSAPPPAPAAWEGAHAPAWGERLVGRARAGPGEQVCWRLRSLCVLLLSSGFCGASPAPALLAQHL